MKTIKIAFILFISLNSNAQNIQKYFCLDTAIQITDKSVSYVNTRRNALLSQTDNNTYVLFTSIDTANQLLLNVINNNNKITSKIRFSFQKEDLNNYHNYISSITCNDSLFVISIYRRIIVYKIDWKYLQLTFLKSLPSNTSYDNIYLANDSILFISDIYKHDYDTPNDNSIILKLNINTNRVEKKLNFTFKNIEFAYFTPNHWVAFDNNKIYVSQTTDYKIELFNHELEKTGEILSNKTCWKNMDSFTMAKFRMTIPKHHPKIYIDSLSIYNDKLINRLIGVWKFNDSSLLTCWINYDSIQNRTRHFIDIYSQDKSGKYKLLKEDIIDSFMFINDSSIADKNFYPIMFWNNKSNISRNGIVVLKNYANVKYLNESWKLINENEKKYYFDNNPIPTVFFYRKNNIPFHFIE